MKRTVLLILCLIVSLMPAAVNAFGDDEHVWAALKKGGKVVLLRHTHVEIREGIGHLEPDNCPAEINLSTSGVEQAKLIGEAFRAHGIAVGQVLTSPYCRCIDTGKLAFGSATPVEYLKPPGVVSPDQAQLNQEQLVQQIADHRGLSNLIIITHDLNISNVVLEDTVPMGEFFVVQPNGANFDVIGKIRLGD